MCLRRGFKDEEDNGRESEPLATFLPALEGVNTVTQDLIKFSVINIMAALGHNEKGG